MARRVVVIVPDIQSRHLPIFIGAAAADPLIKVGVVVVPCGPHAAAGQSVKVDLNAEVAIIAVKGVPGVCPARCASA